MYFDRDSNTRDRIRNVLKRRSTPLTAKQIADVLCSGGNTVSTDEVRRILNSSEGFEKVSSSPARFSIRIFPGAGGTGKATRGPVGKPLDPAGVEAERLSERPQDSLPLDQPALRLGFPLPSVRMYWKPLGNGEVTDDGWEALLRRFKATLDDERSDRVEICHPKFSGAEGQQPTIPIHADRVILGAPQWVAWTVVDSEQSLDSLFRAGWLFWNARRPPDFRRRRESALNAATEVALPVVATWRTLTSFDAARVVVGSLYGALKFRETSELAAGVKRVSEKEFKRRQRVEEGLRRAVGARSRTVGTKRAKPVLGYCELCGLPLTQEASAGARFGPICRQIMAGLDVSVEEIKGHPDPGSWARARSEREWRSTLMERIQRDVRLRT